MEGNRFNLQKLNNHNYSSWRFKVELLLIREELWRYVNPGVKPEDEDENIWNAGDAKTRATIGLLIDDNQHGLIHATTTAKATWTALQNHHQKTSLTSKVSLLKRICDKRFSEGEDMAEHIFALEELFTRLANAGQKLEENLMVAMILRSLPSSYDTLTTALESRSDDDLTLELVKRKLLDEAMKQQGADPGAALKIGYQGNNKQRKPLTCHYCKKAGHKQKECRQFARDAEKDQKPPQGKSRKKEESLSFAFMAGTVDDSETKIWIVDSGATSHTVADRSFFTELRESEVKSVKLADGKLAKVQGEGPGVLVCCDDQGRRSQVKLSKALFTPSLAMNLLSVPALVQKRATVIFDSDGCRIKLGNETAATAMLKHGLYQLNQPDGVTLATTCQHSENCKHVWHRRFGHRDVNAINQMLRGELVNGMKVDDCGVDDPCECCMKGKSSRTPFPKESKIKSKAPMDLVHTDVCGPVETQSVSGFRYFMTIIDDYSRYCVLYFLKEKSEVPNKIREYVEFAKNHFRCKPKIVRSDQGGEYSGTKLRSFYNQEGIKAQYTASYSPQQNGVAERKNRYLVEMARCLLFDANLEQCYWAEALNTAVYLQNILPTRAVDVTPYELWNGVKPEVSNLKIFGSKAWVHVPKQLRKKLSATAKDMTFVGYSSEHKAYRFLDRSTRKIVISRDVRFIEGVPGNSVNSERREEYVEFEFVPKRPERKDLPVADGNKDDDENIENDEDEADFDSAHEHLSNTEDEFTEPDEDDAGASADGDQPIEVRRSERTNKGLPPKRYEVSSVTQSSTEPRNFKEAIQDPEQAEWRAAMEEEMRSLVENQTWELVPLPPGRKVVGCKWTYKKKEDEHGRVVRHKARLVAQGFSQQYGTDYDEVFAPVARQATLRTLLTVASRKELMVKHLDIKTAYLYAELDEDIFMKQPPGFVQDEGLVCRLKRSIYGLKQSARVWNQKIDSVFKKMGFKTSSADSCLYIRERNGKQSFILIYVDDMVVFCQSEREYREICSHLEKHFKLSSLGELRQFLGIHVEKVDGHYTLNQKSYIEKLIGKFGHEDAKPSAIPLDPGYVKQKEESELPSNISYRSLVGSLLYIAVNSRPDICVSTSLLGRKVSNPTNRDWTEAKRVLRYLKATKDLRLHLGSDEGGLECFVDADWAGDESDRKSNSGFLIKFGGGLVCWGTRKQSCVALSSTEAEFVALAEGCQELLWFLKLLEEIKEEQADPIVVWEDNQSCIKMIESERIERRSKHIDTKHAFTKDLYQRGIINLRYLPTAEMEADLMTKPLDRIKLQKHREAIGVKTLT